MRQNAATPLPHAPELPRPGLGAVRVLAWLVVLGFKPESLMRWYGPDKSDYYKFVYLVGE